MASLLKVDLWAGLVADDRRQTVARLRPFTGDDEAALLEVTERCLPAEVITWLLTRLLHSIGDIHPVEEPHALDLTVGDRDRLLFALCASTFSSEMDLTSRCPFEECGELSELTLSLETMARHNPTAPPADFFEKQITLGHTSCTLRFRFPTGKDQETACRYLAKQGSASVETELIQSCLLGLHDTSGAPIAFENRIEEIAPQIETAWSDLDPPADCYAQVDCPACDRSYTAVLDVLALFIAGLKNRGDIFHQVDRLARAYHWSERELLALSFNRRQRYLDLVDSQTRPS